MRLIVGEPMRMALDLKISVDHVVSVRFGQIVELHGRPSGRPRSIPAAIFSAMIRVPFHIVS